MRNGRTDGGRVDFEVVLGCNNEEQRQIVDYARENLGSCFAENKPEQPAAVMREVTQR